MCKITELWKSIFSSETITSNTINMTASSVINYALMFAFWSVTTRMYRPDEVGSLSVVLATISTVLALTNFNIGIVFLRYANHYGDRFGKVAFSATAMIGALSGLVTLLASGAGVIQGYHWLAIVLSASIMAVMSIQDITLMALRLSQIFLIRSALTSLLRIILVVVFVQLSILRENPLWAYMAATFLVVIATHVYLKRIFNGLFHFSLEGLHLLFSHANFALISHVSNLASSVPVYAMPLITAQVLSNAEAATFYLCFSISTPIYLVTYYAAAMLLPHSTGHIMNRNDTRYLQWLLSLYCLGVLLVLPFLPLVLHLLGPHYEETGSGGLQLLALAAIPMTATNLYLAVLRLEREDIAAMLLSMLYGGVVTLTAVLASRWFGVTGIALGFLAGQLALMAGCVTHSIAKGRSIRWLWFDIGFICNFYSERKRDS